MSDTPGNFIIVNSTPDFQLHLSEDLNRISLINFWAPWASPCTRMNEVVLELAKKYPSVLVLHVEAEAQSEITEAFDIGSVPTFLFLRGHTLLGRIEGADAPALTQAIAKHISDPSNPAQAEVFLQTRLEALMAQSKVVLFMKGTPGAPRCGFSRRMVGLLNNQGVEYTHFDILTDESIRQGLKKLNDWPTFPQLIVDGQFVGGLDVVTEMVENGELNDLLK